MTVVERRIVAVFDNDGILSERHTALGAQFGYRSGNRLYKVLGAETSLDGIHAVGRDGRPGWYPTAVNRLPEAVGNL